MTMITITEPCTMSTYIKWARDKSDPLKIYLIMADGSIQEATFLDEEDMKEGIEYFDIADEVDYNQIRDDVEIFKREK